MEEWAGAGKGRKGRTRRKSGEAGTELRAAGNPSPETELADPEDPEDPERFGDSIFLSWCSFTLPPAVVDTELFLRACCSVGRSDRRALDFRSDPFRSGEGCRGQRGQRAGGAPSPWLGGGARTQARRCRRPLCVVPAGPGLPRPQNPPLKPTSAAGARGLAPNRRPAARRLAPSDRHTGPAAEGGARARETA